jgi:exodeoxyribonuclease VII large subunit
MEDLWPFNEEQVVRAIAASKIPTVSAVGHEIDVTLADFTADLRALTPSAAAEMIIPDAQQLVSLLDQLRLRLSRRLTSHVHLLNSRWQALAERPVFKRPFDLVHQRTLRLDDLDLRLERALAGRLNDAKQRWQQASATLHALSPLGTLARGYSLTLADSHKPVRNANDVRPGDRLTTQLAQGKIISEVTECLPD